jgi:hypothetical protein
LRLLNNALKREVDPLSSAFKCKYLKPYFTRLFLSLSRKNP